MKVLLVSVHFHSSFGWSIEQALKRLGHEVRVFDYRNPPIGVPGKVKLLWARTVMPRELAAAGRKFRPDLIFLAKAETVPAETIRGLRGELRCPVVNWFPDARLFASRNVVEQMPHLDFIFSKNIQDVNRTRLIGIRNARFLPHCADRELHVDYETTEEDLKPHRCQVAMVGSYYRYRELMLEHLSDFNLRIWGGGWERSALARTKPECISGREARSLVQTQVFRAAAVNVNPHHFDDTEGLNQRVFDIGGAGGCQLMDGPRDAKPVFDVPDDLAVFQSAEELREKTGFLIGHPQTCRDMGERCRRKVAAGHTYDHRVREILDLMRLA